MESKGGDRGKATITGRVLLCAVGGAVVGAVGWSLLAVPQHLINVIFSVFVGAGAGVATGWWGGSTRSWRTVVIPLVVTAVLLLPIQGWITHQYLSWATDNLGGTPSDPSWDGPVGFIRLALDRAGAQGLGAERQLLLVDDLAPRRRRARLVHGSEGRLLGSLLSGHNPAIGFGGGRR